VEPVAWHSQSRSGIELVKSISGLRRHLPDSFTRCHPTTYSPSVIIEFAELFYRQTKLFYRQPSPKHREDSARVARLLRQILSLLGPSVSIRNFVDTKRKGAPSYSLAMAFEESFKAWEGSHTRPPLVSEWRPVNISTTSLRMDTHGRDFQAITHSPAWTELQQRLQGGESLLRRTPHSLHWDLLSMAVAQIEPTLKPYVTYLPPVNSRRIQDSPPNCLDKVHSWMLLHRPQDVDNRECGSLEFLCTLNILSSERLQYLLRLCKEKRTCLLRRTLLEGKDLLQMPLSFWKGAGHKTDRGGWWVRAVVEELTAKCNKCRRIWPALQLAKDGCTECAVRPNRKEVLPKKKRRLMCNAKKS